MKRKIAHKEAALPGHAASSVPLTSFALGTVAGGLVGAAVGKVVGGTNGSTAKWATAGALAGGALSLRPSPSLDMPQVVDYLQKNLGAKTTAYLTGLDDDSLVGCWANGTAQPEEIEGHRLWSAFEATRTLVEAYDALTARSWFMGMNPAFDDTAPARVLRSSHSQQIWDKVVLAARVFAET